jgi:hypothetical protein
VRRTYVVERAELGGGLVQAGVGREDRAATLSLVANDPTHGDVVVRSRLSMERSKLEVDFCGRAKPEILRLAMGWSVGTCLPRNAVFAPAVGNCHITNTRRTSSTTNVHFPCFYPALCSRQTIPSAILPRLEHGPPIAFADRQERDAAFGVHMTADSKYSHCYHLTRLNNRDHSLLVSLYKEQGQDLISPCSKWPCVIMIDAKTGLASGVLAK